MAKTKKVRISATILPSQRKYLDAMAAELNTSFADALVDLIEIGMQAQSVIGATVDHTDSGAPRVVLGGVRA